MWQFGVKMNIEQTKAKLIEISKSTGTKHPKVLISELCVVVKFLLDEIDRIKTPLLTILPKRIPVNQPDVKIDPVRKHRPIPIQPPWPDRPQPEIPGYRPPGKTPHIYDSIKKYHKGNAGDAE